MKATGIVRKADSLGRLVIPKELRTLFGFDSGQELEVFVDNNGIVIKKYEKSCIFCNTDNALALVSFQDKLMCKACIEFVTDMQCQ